ncbi:hypothetical protein BDR05DRAFT_976076 [Suillus weaverae]|nr:hypothetical protein BDR05DRAFT_976076 [Suillus weaverae]
MGFNMETFAFMALTSGFAEHWYHKPIPRDDVSQYANPCIGHRSLDARGVLGLILHYLNLTMHQISLQQIFALIPMTVSWYLLFGIHILLLTLHNMADAKICWLCRDKFEECSALVVAHGLKLPAQTSDDADIENATFNGWLSEHFISLVLTFSSQDKPHSFFNKFVLTTCISGIIIAARTNAPGSWHNSHECMTFNHKLLSYRQTAKWDTEACGDLIETCVHLHNLHAKRVGINQICTVYMNHWQATDEDLKVWHDFENMLFSKQRQKDRVTRFHVTLEYQ